MQHYKTELWRNRKSALCHIYCENEDHSQQSDCRQPRKCRHYLEGTDSYCEGPQRHPAEGLQSHQCRTQSPWKERGSVLTNGGETERNWPLFAHSVATYRTWSRELHWASVTRWGRCMPTSPSTWLFRRMVLLWKSEIFWVKNTHAGFEWGQGLPVQYLKPRKMSWFLKEMTLNLCQIQLLWLSKPPQLKTRISENFGRYLCFGKRNSSAGWWIRSQWSCCRNKIADGSVDSVVIF